MKKIKYIIKRIIHMDFGNFFHVMNEVHKKSNKNRVSIFFDMIYCGFKYQAGYMDYALFEMYHMNKYERNTVITRGINNSFMVKYNDPKFIHLFHNKVEFNKQFDKYLNRDWLYLNGKNKNEFASFCLKHNQIIVKPVGAQCGKDIEKIDVSERKLKDLYEELIENNQTLIESVATQCKKINDLHPDSINTLRVVTLLGSVVACYLRIGNNHNTVDNFNHGGMVAPVELENGKIIYPAIDKAGNLYEVHPLTKKPIVGLEIPKFDEVIELCENAALEIPQVGYVGWDVCVGKEKCFFIEANEFPGHDIYGLPPHRKNNTGLLPVFKEAEERKFEE
ncbi:MAG: hypothetical protein HFI08_03515 [Bacilli bacterium]|nr:hypothetical protein [Bacilli bacterium]